MELFMNALLNTLMGMGTVFVVLIFISLLISLFVYVPQIEEKLKGGKKKEAEPVKAVKQAPQIIEEEEEEELVQDEALVAVIMAAIMAYQGDGANTTSTDKLVVRSIRRAKRTNRR